MMISTKKLRISMMKWIYTILIKKKACTTLFGEILEEKIWRNWRRLEISLRLEFTSLSCKRRLRSEIVKLNFSLRSPNQILAKISPNKVCIKGIPSYFFQHFFEIAKRTFIIK